MASIVLFQLDLRLSDHAALQAAVQRGGPIIPVFLWQPSEEEPWAPGAASRWWLHHSLASLEKSLAREGSRLIIRQGDTLESLLALVRETGADAVFWNRRYEPACIKRESLWEKKLSAQGVHVQRFHSNLLFNPAQIATQSGKPFQVFTPFWQRCMNEEPATAPPERLFDFKSPAHWPASHPLVALKLLPKLPWADGFSKRWTPGWDGARHALSRFVREGLETYQTQRDYPSIEGSSSLSPHLHFGELSPRQVWWAIRGRIGAETFLREIGWREFAYHLLVHFPHTPEKALHAEFDGFRWSKDAKTLNAWQKGRTGFPIVDAGMRQLWATGWMHNRVRMIVGSFLVKDLRISWLEGARWFWDTLVDADLANNTLNWQWVGGCGADAAPFFRIFNPELQQKRFDANGRYVKHWVREADYPPPIVDHAQAREDALLRYKEIRKRPAAD